MGRPKLSSEQKRRLISLRIIGADHSELKRQAEDAGMSLCAFAEPLLLLALGMDEGERAVQANRQKIARLERELAEARKSQTLTGQPNLSDLMRHVITADPSKFRLQNESAT